MKRLFPLLLTLLLFPLPGCGLGNGIPRGLDWQALTVTDQKGGALLSAAPGWEGGKDVPRLSLSVQVEADSVVLTRPETGERWSGTLAPGEALSAPGIQDRLDRFAAGMERLFAEDGN